MVILQHRLTFFLAIGPSSAVQQWRATTLTLLSKRAAFLTQRAQDTEAVVQEIYHTLSALLPPPAPLEEQIQESLRNVMRAAVEVSIEMRTQQAEYMMLPPLQPEFDSNGELARKVYFNAALMNNRSGGSAETNEELEAQGAVVHMVLFPLVVKKGDDAADGTSDVARGGGGDEVVCPAQVLVASPATNNNNNNPKKVVRVLSGDRMSVEQQQPGLMTEDRSVQNMTPSSLDMSNMI